MKRKLLSHAEWELIRADCEAGRKISEIALAHGIDRSTIYRRRKDWLEASDGCSLQKPSASGPDHSEMVKRLYHATEQQIHHLEEKLQNGDAAFDEKEAWMLGTIARTLDKILEIAPKASPLDRHTPPTGKIDKEAAHDDDATQVDPDALRKELAIRLDRLQQGGKSGVSGDAQSPRTQSVDV